MRQKGLAVKPLLTMAKHRKELLSKECGIMESGFDTDPAMEILWMPDHEDKEKDGKSPTETSTSVDGASNSRPGDRDSVRDSAN